LVVKVQDNGTGNLSRQATVTVSLTDVNEAPDVNDQAFSILEFASNSTSVGNVNASDPDSDQFLSYLITSGNSGNAFTINTSTGEITVADNALLNYEINPIFNLTIKVIDNGIGSLSDIATITITISQEPNQAPIISDQSFSITENSANGTTVGTVVASDPDPNQTLAFVIIYGNNNNIFSINALTGELTLIDSSALDKNSSFLLGIAAFDNGLGYLFSAANITVSLIPASNEPPVISDQKFPILKNSSNGSSVGIVKASDPNPDQLLTFSILSGNQEGIFTINSFTGELFIANSNALGIFPNDSVQLVVNVQDNGSVSMHNQATVTIFILSSNVAPVILSQTKNIQEHQPIGTIVGIVTASGSNSEYPLTYSIIDGNISNSFAIDEHTGCLTINNPTSVCFEGHPVFNLTIKVKDNVGLTSEGIVTINVADINEKPVSLDQTFSILENSPIQTLVETVVAKDFDFNQTLTYSIVSGNINEAFKIDSSNGSIFVNNQGTINFEDNSSFNLVISVQDNGLGNLTTLSDIAINVLDVNEPPVLENQILTVVENSAPGTEVGYVKAKDPDQGQKIKYMIVAGNEVNIFNLDETSGLISVADPSKLSFGHNSLISLTVIAQDNGIDSLSTLSVVTIDILRDTSEIVTTGIDINVVSETFSEQDISIFPNPTADFVNIDLRKVLDQSVGIRIFSMNGAEIYSTVKKGEKNVVINLEKEGPGTYIASLDLNGKIYNKNIVVKN